MGQPVVVTDRSLAAASAQQMQDLLEGAWAVRDAAEQRRRVIRQAFELIAKKLCSQSLDQHKIDLAEIDDQALFDFIITDAKGRLDEGLWYKRYYDDQADAIQAATKNLSDQLAAANTVAESLRAELAQTKQELEDVRTANRGYTADLATLQAKIVLLERAVREAQTLTPGNGDSLPVSALVSDDSLRMTPDWLERWMQSSTYTVDAAFLQMVGASEECRRQVLIETFAQRERSREGRASGADEKITERLIKSGLLISIPVTGLRGNAPHLLRLDIKGKEAYRHIFEKDPLDIYDRYLSKHKSTAQTYLMLQACDALAGAGFQIERLPRTQLLPDNKIFDPDLRVWRGAEELFVEIETEAYKNEPQRKAKWLTIAAGTRGYIYVIARDTATASLVRSEIMDIRYGRPVSVGVTSLPELIEATRRGEPLWGQLRSIT
jgi:hypothetical protein